MSIAAVVLAAGASRRLGRPKQDVVLGDETLLERAVRIAQVAALEPVFVVVSAAWAGSVSPGAAYLVNESAEEGMASSIRIGVAAAALANAEAIVIMACDQPAVTAEHLRELMCGGDEIVASAYGARRGVPAYFSASVFGQLLRLKGDTGARTLLKTARAIRLPQGDLDIDTAEDLERARRLYGGGAQAR